MYATEPRPGSAPTHEKTNPRLELTLALKLERRQQELESLLPIIRSKTGTPYICSPCTKPSTPAYDITVGEVGSSLKISLSWTGYRIISSDCPGEPGDHHRQGRLRRRRHYQPPGPPCLPPPRWLAGLKASRQAEENKLVTNAQ